MTALEALIEYNKRDIEMCNRQHELEVAMYRLEYLPLYGSAWYNMMLHDISISHYKE